MEEARVTGEARPPTCSKSLKELDHIELYSVHLPMGSEEKYYKLMFRFEMTNMNSTQHTGTCN